MFAPAVQNEAEARNKSMEEIAIQLGRTAVKMNVTDWSQEQLNDETLRAAIEWICDKK